MFCTRYLVTLSFIDPNDASVIWPNKRNTVEPVLLEIWQLKEYAENYISYLSLMLLIYGVGYYTV
jgi:hypothetical protein